jgi:hypothetical protein
VGPPRVPAPSNSPPPPSTAVAAPSLPIPPRQAMPLTRLLVQLILDLGAPRDLDDCRAESARKHTGGSSSKQAACAARQPARVPPHLRSALWGLPPRCPDHARGAQTRACRASARNTHQSPPQTQPPVSGRGAAAAEVAGLQREYEAGARVAIMCDGVEGITHDAHSRLEALGCELQQRAPPCPQAAVANKPNELPTHDLFMSPP